MSSSLFGELLKIFVVIHVAMWTLRWFWLLFSCRWSFLVGQNTLSNLSSLWALGCAWEFRVSRGEGVIWSAWRSQWWSSKVKVTSTA